ncbi:MAG: ATP-binding protein [Chloroflexota bacterium]
MTAPSLPLSIWQTLLRPSPSLPECQTLMEQISSAALLVNSQRDQIVLSNQKAHEISGYSEGELETIDLSELLPEYPFEGYPRVEGFNSVLTTRNELGLRVRLNLIPLLPKSPWLLFIIRPLYEQLHIQELQTRDANLENDLLSLTSISPSPNTPLEDILKQVLISGQPLVCSESLMLYQVNSAVPEISLFASSGPTDHFPQSIPPSDLLHLKEKKLWLQGTPPRASLHRRADAANLRYLASTPVGPSFAPIGILVSAHSKTNPIPNLLAWMDILAAKIDQTVELYVRFKNLNNNLEQQAPLLARLKKITEHTQDGLLVTDPAGKIIELNRSAEEILRYKSEEVKGTPVEDVIVGSPTIATALEAARRGKATSNLYKIPLHRRDGEDFPAQVEIRPIHHNDVLVNIVIFLRDLSEQVRIHLKAQQLQKRAEFGDMTAISVHEIRNTINVLSTGLQLLASQLNPQSPFQVDIYDLQEECERLSQLTDDMLSFTRPSEGHKPVHIGAVVSRVFNFWKPRFQRFNITSYLHIAPDTPMILGDAQALNRVFINLVDNAVRVMKPNGGTLSAKISANKNDEGQSIVEVSISDTGPGIPQENQERIFEPFFSTHESGTGIGLVVVKNIVKNHNGSINLQSFPGGTIFTLQFPAYHPETTDKSEDT